MTDDAVKHAQMVVDTMLSHGSDLGFKDKDVMRAAISAAIEAMSGDTV
jgi:hypothetical protein